MNGSIAVVTSGFPRRSETFVLNELIALDRAGVLAGVFATKAGDGLPPQPGAERLDVQVLAPGSPVEQGRALAAELRRRHVAGVHGYFAHAPAEVAAVAAGTLGVRFGFSVHARDARKIPIAELGARATEAACVVACNADVAADVRRAGGDVEVLPHGVDLERFRPRERRPDGSLALLAVGRLVEKKGFHVLIDAVARLAAPFRLRIVGDGPEHARLEQAIRRHGLAGTVELTGALTHDELPAVYGQADVVVAPSIADAGGDRDGLPNVVLEAMASGLPVVGGDVGALATALGDEAGVLVPAGDEVRLAEALDSLENDANLRARLGRAARARVERGFDLRRCTERLVERLRVAYG